MEEEGANPAAIAIIRLLAFTGARKNEIARLRWSEVDLGSRLSSSRRFQDWCKNHSDRRCQPAKCWQASRSVDDSPYVFPASSGDGAFQGTEKVWRKLRERVGFPELRLHDLRHSFASVGLARGDTLPVIGAILGHTDVKTTSRYAHLADDPVRQSAEGISKVVAAALSGESVASVVQLRRRGSKA
jgi:integrase